MALGDAVVLEDLPRVDEHVVDIAAETAVVWQAALSTFAAVMTRWQLLARSLGVQPATMSRWETGAVGASIPGFRIVAADPPDLLAIAGRHRFARYAIALEIDSVASGSRCRLESRAVFPGMHGRLYRAAVVGTRFHVLAVRRLLGEIKSQAEEAAGSADTR